MNITLPDGSHRAVEDGSTFLDLATSIGPGLAKAVVAASLDGVVMDIQQRIPREGAVRLFKATDPEGQAVVRHSCEHVLATAVVRLFKGAQVTMGPADHSKDFYYDFDIGRPFTPADLEKIEAEMTKVIAEKVPFDRKEVSKDEAAKIFGELGQRFKPEILEWIKDDTVTLYQDADFVNLCRGPHVPHAGHIGAFKLLGAAGSYWRGDHTKDQLQRIRGVAFENGKALKRYFAQLEQAKARDHRKLGKELGLVGFSPIAPASPFFFPKGTVVYNKLIDYVRRLYKKYDYQEVVTPQIFSTELYKTSGHYDNFLDNMYFAAAGKGDDSQEDADAREIEWSVKPMNCPGHCVMYGMTLHSFRDLPWRVADFGRLHRAEGEAVHGLMRVRTFAQDDAHIFCTPEQQTDEMGAFIDLVDEVYRDLALGDVKVKLATRPEKRIGDDAVWDRAESDLASVLDAKGRAYELAPGEGAFYGPKLEFHVKDALERQWQLGTLQVDFSMPKRFGLEYVGSDGARHTPVMLHRAILGSLERFFGVYLEHTGGVFPAWLAPVQVKVLPVTDRSHDHGRQLHDELKARGARVEVDLRSEKLGFKMREAEKEKVPFILVVGDKEAEKGGASVRLHGGQDLGYLDRADVMDRIELATRMPGHDQS